MDRLLKGFTVYDPSEIKVRLTRSCDGKEFKLYGFSADLRISYADNGILFHLQATSGCVPTLLQEVDKLFILSISSEMRIKEFLEYFDGFEGYLQLKEAEIIGNEVTQVIFKLHKRLSVNIG